jgi:putative tryptophan/tyrosine transport system substrate-binding protein
MWNQLGATMRRREFLSLLGGVATAWPLMARAQPTMPVIGFLGSSSAELYAPALRTFRQGLGETGYVEGRNVSIEFRWANGQNDLLPALAADLVRRGVNVIVAPGSTPAALAAKGATAKIPVVFQVGIDPVAGGLVTSLARPGGNITGVTNINTELASKRLELLRELVPKATVAALLVNPTSPEITKAVTTDLQSTARKLGLELHVVQASAEGDFDTVFANLARLGVGALVIAPDAFFISRGHVLGALTARHGVPAITQFREFAAAGGLMSYGGSFTEPVRQVGIYTGRILKGEKPADLPVQQPMKVELVINLKTAKAFGITVPQSVQNRADEIIE